MKSNVIYDIQTDEYSIYCENQHRQESPYLIECYVKTGNGIHYRVRRSENLPSIFSVLLETKLYSPKSFRPYRAGQACDGSIGAPALHLYVQLCNAFHLDPLTLYNQAYTESPMQKEELNQLCDFAMWQGVETILLWDQFYIERVLESLTEINHHQLRSIVEDHLNNFIHFKTK